MMPSPTRSPEVFNRRFGSPRPRSSTCPLPSSRARQGRHRHRPSRSAGIKATVEGSRSRAVSEILGPPFLAASCQGRVDDGAKARLICSCLLSSSSQPLDEGLRGIRRAPDIRRIKPLLTLHCDARCGESEIPQNCQPVPLHSSSARSHVARLDRRPCSATTIWGDDDTPISAEPSDVLATCAAC